MPFIHPDKIIVPGSRFRTPNPDSQDFKELVDSIKQIGQLQSVLVSAEPVVMLNLEPGTFELIAGANRVEACKVLNREVWYETDLTGQLDLSDPAWRRVAELHENVRRKDFEVIERARAVEEIDMLMRKIYGEKPVGRPSTSGTAETGEWTREETAKKLGFKSATTVNEDILIAQAARVIPQVAEAKTRNEALKIVKDSRRMAAAQVLAERESLKPQTEIGDPNKFFAEKIVVGCGLKNLKALPNGIASLFITDPPWKIDMDKVTDKSGSAVQKASAGYDDSSEDILPLLSSVITEMYRVAKEDAIVIMFCGIAHFNWLVEQFREAKFSTLSIPMIWVKTRNYETNLVNKVACNAPAYWPSIATDFMIMARKGDYQFYKKGDSNVFLHPPTSPGERFHQAQKPVRLMEEIIARFYHPGTNPLLIDPFAGSASTLVAARRIGIKQYLGFELDPGNREKAIAYMVNCWAEDQAKAESDVAGDVAVEIGDEEFE